MNDDQSKRGGFSSSLGFVMAAAGSAIGLGHLWKFPYLAGSNGGGIFILFYFAFTLILGKPLFMSETAIGRFTARSTISAYYKINKKWTFIGVIGVFCAFIILSYYSVVGGWVLKYIYAYCTGENFGSNTMLYFDNFSQSAIEPVIWHLIFMFITAMVILAGVTKGIEKSSKIMIPILFVLIIVVAIRSVTFDGATQGLKFLFVPDFSLFNSFDRLIKVIASSMEQVFFTLSLGFGATLTYGSYMKKDTSIPKSTNMVILMGSLMAILSGMAILPAVFAFGFEPSAGPGLIFATLPSIFASMPFGRIFGLIFFILIFFAALTSSIALLEVVTACLIDILGWSRKKATAIMASLMGLIGVLASMSKGVLASVTIAGMNIFESMGFLTDKILMPIACISMCIFVGFVWGINNITSEIQADGTKLKLKKLFCFNMKYLAPILIAILFILELVPKNAF